MNYQVYCDGACRPNPGIMAIGAAILKDDDDGEFKEVHTISERLHKGTNNIAEYTSLVESARWLAHYAERNAQITIYMDSELVVKQMRGEYSVGNPVLRDLHGIVVGLLSRFNWKIEHIRREKNQRADSLAGQAYD